MKIKHFQITLLAIISITLFTCERDDLCDEDTPTTPRMIFEFRDVAIPENTKNAIGLRVEDPDDSARFLEDYNDVSTLQMIIPLKTDADETKYVVYKNYNIDDNGTANDTSDDFQTGNADTLTITYSREDIYVSRACSYKTTFKNITVTIEPDSDNWMLFQEQTNDNQTVINEDETHWKIRH
jgi:hypothetical protein